jgi:hypothetical protein
MTLIRRPAQPVAHLPHPARTHTLAQPNLYPYRHLKKSDSILSLRSSLRGSSKKFENISFEKFEIFFSKIMVLFFN